MSESDQRLGSLNEAREAFVRALKSHEHFVYKLGYEAGFEAGWEAVVRRLASQKPDLSMAPSHHNPADMLHSHEVEGPARDTLMAIIAQSPGLERHEIIETARKTASSLSERSLRTALQALRDTGVLRVDSGKWYLVSKDFEAKEPVMRPVTAADFDE
jgi:hypothetical protein